MPSPRGSSRPRDRIWVSRMTGIFFTLWTTRDMPYSPSDSTSPSCRSQSLAQLPRVDLRWLRCSRLETSTQATMCDPSRCWLGLSKRSNLASALAGLGSSSLAPLCFHIDCCLLATSLPVVLSMSYRELHSISLVEINSPLLLVLPSVIPQKFTRFLTKAANLKSIHQMAPEHCIPRVQASLHLQENPEVPPLWDEKVQPQEPVQQRLIFPLQLPRVFNLGLYQRERDRIFLTFFIFISPSLDSGVKSKWWTLQNKFHEYFPGPCHFHLCLLTVLSVKSSACYRTACQ